MKNTKNYPSKAEMLASLVTGRGDASITTASVQRSHRFPLHLFTQIENLAQMGGVSVSMIINELLDCGLDALKAEMSDEEISKITRMSKEQMERPTVMLRDDSKKRKAAK